MDQNHKIDRRCLTLALLVALVVRAGVLVTIGSSLADDPDAYRQIAVGLSDSGTYALDGVSTAYRPPFYPSVLYFFCTDPISVAIIHLVFGLLTVTGTFLLCVRVGLARWAFFAAMLVAFDPILLNQSTQVMTETTVTMLVVFTMLGLVQLQERPILRQAGFVGLMFGFAALCRPELLAWAGLCIVSLPFVSRLTCEAYSNTSQVRWLTGTRSGMKLALVAIVVLILTLTPWTVRNWMVFGRPIPATTHGGYTLLLANNHAFYEYLRSGEWGSTWDADELGPRWAGKAKFASPAEELQADRDAYREAWSNIRRQPGMFFYSCIVRAGRLWGIIPHQGPTAVRYAIGLWYLVFYVLAMVGAWTVCRKKVVFCRAKRVVLLWGGDAFPFNDRCPHHLLEQHADAGPSYPDPRPAGSRRIGKIGPKPTVRSVFKV